MKFKFLGILLLFIAIGFTNCNSNSKNNRSGNTEYSVSKKSAYEKIELAFIGHPNEEEIKPILDKVIEFHGGIINEDTRERSGNVLVSLRKSSKNGVTEMDILKHMAENGASELTFPNQAAISFTLLETN